MTVPVLISLSGPLVSFLLFENSKCKFQQEGFLLGEIIQKETKKITDNDQQQISVRNTVKICSVLPCPQRHFFYSGTGIINKSKIKEFLGDEINKVVGWYNSHKISSYKMSLRDRIIHKQLIDLFQVKADVFTFCYVINEISDNGSTHQFSQVFMRLLNDRYDHLPIHILNLSEPNNVYKTPEPTSETFTKLLTELNIDKQNTQGLTVINKIHKALQKHIDKLVQDLHVSEQHLQKMENEVNILDSERTKDIHKKEDLNKSLEFNEEQNDTKRKLLHEANISPKITPDISRSKQINSKSTVRGRGRERRGNKTY